MKPRILTKLLFAAFLLQGGAARAQSIPAEAKAGLGGMAAATAVIILGHQESKVYSTAGSDVLPPAGVGSSGGSGPLSPGGAAGISGAGGINGSAQGSSGSTQSGSFFSAINNTVPIPFIVISTSTTSTSTASTGTSP